MVDLKIKEYQTLWPDGEISIIDERLQKRDAWRRKISIGLKRYHERRKSLLFANKNSCGKED